MTGYIRAGDAGYARQAATGGRAVTHQIDENVRNRFPMLPDDRIRVVADCSCGWGMDGPERVWDWLSDQHAHAHNKGINGLAAAATWNVQHITAEEPEPEPSPEPEPECEAEF